MKKNFSKAILSILLLFATLFLAGLITNSFGQRKITLTEVFTHPDCPDKCLPALEYVKQYDRTTAIINWEKSDKKYFRIRRIQCDVLTYPSVSVDSHTSIKWPFSDSLYIAIRDSALNRLILAHMKIKQTNKGITVEVDSDGINFWFVAINNDLYKPSYVTRKYAFPGRFTFTYNALPGEYYFVAWTQNHEGTGNVVHLKLKGKAHDTERIQ